MFDTFAGLDHVHFVGIGGSGMSGIAEILLGYRRLRVSGCDRAASAVTERLEGLGVTVHVGHDEAHLDGVDLVVKSSAVPDDNPEIQAARARGITVVRRAEMLGELMRLKYGIAVAGTHGKTTTTSLIGTLLTEAGLDPTVIVGGRMRVSGTGARIGQSHYLVAEADEFDRSFLRLMPILAVVTSIDSDHLDTYRDLDAIREAFFDFATRVPFFGAVILCLDDDNNQRMLPRLAGHRVITYGLSPQADLCARDVEATPDGCTFVVHSMRDGRLGPVALPMPGQHNVQNALAAVAVGLALELPFSAIAEALARFGGVHRRFERIGSFGGAAVVDDYAHHPTEIEATLRAARQAFPHGRVHAIFQPHLYSRTRDLGAEFGRALMLADRAWVAPIYASREAPIAGISADTVIDAARASGHRHVERCDDWAAMPTTLAGAVAAQDVVLTLGAGDIVRLGQQIAASDADALRAAAGSREEAKP
ncbi:MAG: UDP-N-acetylmuramate--L-alanine ligase [Acidobacteriota bacterium]